MHHLAWPTSKWILPLIACYPLLPKPQPFSSTSFRFKEETEGVKGIVHFYPDIYTSWRPMCYIFYLFILLLVARLCLPIWAENEFFFLFIFYFLFLQLHHRAINLPATILTIPVFSSTQTNLQLRKVQKHSSFVQGTWWYLLPVNLLYHANSFFLYFL